MKFFFSYLKSRRMNIGLFFLFEIIHLVVAVLCRLPLAAVLYPMALCMAVGLILLIKKLSDNPQRTKKVVSDTAEHLRSKAQEMRQEQQTRKTQSGKQSAVKKVTQTPQLSDKGAKVMKIIGIVLAALGGVALLGVAENWLGYAIEYNEWW